MKIIKNLFKKQEKPIPQPIAEPDVPKQSGIYDAIVMSQARNPQWVYVRILGMDGKHPVIIPRRLTGKLAGKTVKVEAITDSNGTSYRYIHQP